MAKLRNKNRIIRPAEIKTPSGVVIDPPVSSDKLLKPEDQQVAEMSETTTVFNRDGSVAEKAKEKK